jgi:hypothetical protein
MYRRNDGEKDRETFADQGTVEIFREKTIEDMIDEQRAKLAAEGKVSPTTILIWTRCSCGQTWKHNSINYHRKQSDRLLRNDYCAV